MSSFANASSGTVTGCPGTGPAKTGDWLTVSSRKLIWMGRKYERLPWGFTLDYEEENDRHDGHVLFDARIYDPSGVRRFVERYQRLLIAVSRHPDKTLDALLATNCQTD